MLHPNQKLLILLLLLLFGCQVLLGQYPLSFTKYREDDGLSNGFVTSIYQDHLGFLWLGTPRGINRFDGHQFKVYEHIDNDSTSLSHNEVWAIFEDQEDYIWVGTNNGLNKFDPKIEKSERYYHQQQTPNSLSNNSIESIQMDTAGQLWIGTVNGLNRYLPETNSFRRYFDHEGLTYPFKGLYLSRNGTFWAGALDTLYRYLPSADRFETIPLPAGNQDDNSIRLIYEDPLGYLWIGTQLNGAFKYDPSANTFLAHYQSEAGNPNSLTHNKIAAFQYHEGRLWIGTYGGGLNILDLNTNQIQQYPGTSEDPQGVNSETIRSILKDNKENIWLGTFYDGLYQFKRTQSWFTNFNQSNGLSGKKVQSFASAGNGKIWLSMGTGGIAEYNPKSKNIDRILNYATHGKQGFPKGNVYRVYVDQTDRIWLVTASSGLTTFDPDTEQFTPVLLPSNGSGCLDWVESIFPDTENNEIWIASHEGLCRYSTADQTFRSYLLPDVSTDSIRHGNNNFLTILYKDNNQDLWVGSYGGINRFDPKTDSFQFYPFKHQILGLYEDSKGRFWVGTIGGLYLFNRDTYQFAEQAQGGIRDVPVSSMQEDRNGLLWFASDGIRRLEPETGELAFFDEKDGLVCSGFWASHLDQNGNLYFGGTDGFSVFHPDSLAHSPTPPLVALTDFRLANQSVPLQGIDKALGSKASPIQHLITYTNSITLSHQQNYFSLEFAALDLTAPESNRYRYQLEGYDQDWITTTADRRFTTYTNLNAGFYTFKVQAALRNGEWSDQATTLKIRILPPWWASWWAFTLYGLTLIGLLRLFYVFQFKRKLAQAEAAHYRDLDKAKTQLFTNISHELRTPLTVILGMTDQIRQDPDNWVDEGTESIQRNGDQLLNLINHILDLSRLESNSFPIQYQQGDIIPYLAYLVHSFQSYAAGKNIDLQFVSKLEQFNMDFAPDQLPKIINNLLGNALKFTPDGGNVRVKVDQEGEFLQIAVIDSGSGIPEQEIPLIFDRFYQMKNPNIQKGAGTGLGLALVKELMEKMEGSIRVQSNPNVQTTFEVRLPVRNNAPAWSGFSASPASSSNPSTAKAVSSSNEGAEDDAPLVLIVEDNPDVANYLATCLQGTYRTELATDGHEGLQKAFALIPDMIISDVMMPKVDGFELCNQLKTDQRTSHIPIIILTAKADDDSRIEGLRRGADAYLAKPFNREELEIRLSKLIELRRQLRQYFAQFPENSQTKNDLLMREDAFLERIKSILEKHITDENFGIPELCQALHMSRSQLHRKLKALTGKSTSLVIRSIKLQKARKLILQTQLNISEVAYQTGFINPSHFSSVFTEEFGVSPSSLRENPKMQQ